MKFITYSKYLDASPIQNNGETTSIENIMMQETDFQGAIPVDAYRDPALFMVENGEVVPRPTFGVSVVEEGGVVTISDLPPSYEIFVDMGEGVDRYPVSAATFELTDPGAYGVIIVPEFPYVEERHDVAIV